MKISRKILFMCLVSLLLTILLVLALVYQQMSALSRVLIKETVQEKLNGDLKAMQVYVEKYHGILHLEQGALVDGKGIKLTDTTFLVDKIKEDLGIFATIFQIDGDDFRRVSTNIIDDQGNRAVGTYLGKSHAAYSAVMEGRQFAGEATILGKPYITTYKPIFQKEKIIGLLFIGASQKEALALANRYAFNTLVYIVLLSVLAMTLTLFVFSIVNNSIINKPILKTVKKLHVIFDDEVLQLQEDLPVTTKDEIGEIAGSFNHALQKIRKLVGLVKNQSVVLKDIGQSLSSNMEVTASSINEINATIQSIKNQTLNQSASVEQAGATMKEISQGIETLNVLIEDQPRHVQDSSSAVEEMMSNIGSVARSLVKNSEILNRLNESSEAGRSNLSKIVGDLKDVAKESEKLLEISRVIATIASQTNLLSMNAAIEAAHAGTSGMGFSVVANEVRKLAESSGSQAKLVASVLDRVKGSITRISKSAEDVLADYTGIQQEMNLVNSQESTIRSAMEEQAEGSRLVLDAIGQLNEITLKVKQSSQEMMTGSKEVIRETGNLTDITEEISRGMNEMASGAIQVGQAVNDVNFLSGQNRDSIDQLVLEIEKFRIE